MSLTPAMIDAMVASGCTAEQMAAVMKAALADDEAKLNEKRAKDAERQRKSRANRGLSRDVTVTECDSCDEPLSRPPNEINSNPPTHTPEGYIPRAREAFPKPDFADPQHWADFLQNRKRKKLSNTATAHEKLMRDIAKLADDEWPPGRLIEYAAAKGWGGIYDPREQDDNHGKPQFTSHRPPAKRSSLDAIIAARNNLSAG